MTTFLGSYERPRRQPLGEVSRIGRLVRLSEDTLSAVVELGNEQFELPVSPGKYVLGANVAVLESKGKPRRVSGPAGVWPEGLDADADAPDTVTAVEQLGPRELTEAEAQAIIETADNLAEAQQDLEDARTEAQQNFEELDDKLGTAFPTGIFNVGEEITASAGAVATAAALDAQTKATDAAQAAQTAAEQYAAGEIGEAELRAAQDAEAKANAAKDLAIAAAATHADGAASAAQQAALAGAQAYADAAQAAATAVADAAQADADVAMTTADGKNRVTYSVVSSAPGSTPDIPTGARLFDMHRNRLADGTIVAEWVWSGTAWVPVHMGDEVLRSLDVGKLTAGTANIETAVVNKLWVEGLVARAATFSRATIAAQNLIPGIEALSQYGTLTPEEQNASPFREFEIHTGHPSLSLTGRENGWIWANIRVRAGERYRISVDVLSPTTAGAHFSIQTRSANSDGSNGNVFTSWTDLKSSDNSTTAASFPFSGTSISSYWTSFWSERTATADGVISFLVQANTTSGASNTGPQRFRNFTMRSMTDGNMLVDGAVTARTLNVVPNAGTGGMELLPPGLRIIPSDAEAGTAVSLRTDEENWLAFAKNGETTFSVGPDGDMVAETVEARQSLLYRGTELQESLNARDRGIMAMARNTAPVSIGSSEGRLLAVSFQAPSDNRMVEIRVMGRVGTSALRRAALRLKQSATGTVTPLNSTQKTWYIQTDWAESFDLSVTRSVSEWGWVAGDTVTLGVFVESLTAGESLSFPDGAGQEIIVKDAGPWLAIQGHAPWAPTSGGGGGGGNETAPTPRAYTRSWNSTGHRTYSYTALSHVRASQSLVQGAIAGSRSRGHWIFDDANIRSELNGADATSGTLTIRNQHTYAASGMTAVLRYHNYSSAPETFGTSTAWTSVHVKRGGTVTVPLTATILNGLKGGTIRGFSLDAGDSTSSTHYGYFSPSASLKINYRK